MLLKAIKLSLQQRVAGISGHRYSCGIAGSVDFAIILAWSSVTVPGTVWSKGWAVSWSICRRLSFPLPYLSPVLIQFDECLEDCSWLGCGDCPPWERYTV